MKFFIEDVLVLFPFKIIFPEQIQLMYILKKLFDKKSHGLMGIPAGVGYSMAIISFFISYKCSSTNDIKLRYCLRKEVDANTLLDQLNFYFHNLEEADLKTNEKYHAQIITDFKKKTLCLDPRLKLTNKSDEIEDFCSSLTSKQLYRKKARENYNAEIGSNRSMDLKNDIDCNFYSNFIQKRNKIKSKKVWTITELRKIGIREKICPFYYSRDMLFDAEIIIASIKNFFFNDFSVSSYRKTINPDYIIFENIYDIESIQLIFSSTSINHMVIDDAQRSLFFLKKKFFFSQSKKWKDKSSTDYFFVEPMLEIRDYRTERMHSTVIHDNNPEHAQIKERSINYFSVKKEKENGIKRIFHVFILIQKLLDFILSKIDETVRRKYTAKEFLYILIQSASRIKITIDSIQFLNFFLHGLFTSLGLFNYRKINGLLRLIEFLRIICQNGESFNENFRIFFDSGNQKFPILTEPIINLSCLESSFLMKSIFESFGSVILCSSDDVDMKFILFFLDIKPHIFGNLYPFFVKKNIFSLTSTSYQESSFDSNGNKILPKNSMIKKAIFLINKLLDENVEGMIILCPSIYFLNTILLEWKKELFLGIVNRKRKMFFENLNEEENLLILEEYKLACDFGIKTIFFGLNDSIINDWNLKTHYCRNLLIVDPVSFEIKPSSRIFNQNSVFFLEKKNFRDCKKYFFIKNIWNFMKNYFPSKYEFGSLILIKSETNFSSIGTENNPSRFSINLEKNQKTNEIFRIVHKFLNRKWLTSFI